MPNDKPIAITVKLFGGLRELVGDSSISVSLSTHAMVTDLLGELRHRYPKLCEKLEPGLTKGYLNVLIDGRNIRSLVGFDTALSNGSTIAFLPPVGGG